MVPRTTVEALSDKRPTSGAPPSISLAEHWAEATPAVAPVRISDATTQRARHRHVPRRHLATVPRPCEGGLNLPAVSIRSSCEPKERSIMDHRPGSYRASRSEALVICLNFAIA